MKQNIIILAAGEGTRLRPLTNNTPKGMVNFFGRALLRWQIDLIKSCGLTDITIVGGHKINELHKLDCPIIDNNQYATSNMVWSLYQARHLIRPGTIVTYGDILYHPNILSDLLESSGDISISVDKQWRHYWEARSENPIQDTESLLISETGTVINIGGKVSSMSEPEGQYMGLIKLGEAGADFIIKLFEIWQRGAKTDLDVRNCYMTDLLQFAIDNNISIFPVFTHNLWVEVDTLSDYELPLTKSRIKNIINEL